MAEDNKKFFGFLKNNKKNETVTEDPFEGMSSEEVDEYLEKHPSENPNNFNDSKNTSDSDIVETPESIISLLREKIDNLEKQKNDANLLFAKMNQTIGELRSKISSQEKHINHIESKISISNDMIKVVNPSQVEKDFEEQKAKLDAADAKIESFISMCDSILLEIKNVDSKVSAIGNSSDVLAINKDMQALLKRILEKESKLSMKMEKSENLFYDMQKNYTQSLRYFSIIDSIESSLKEISSEQQKISLSLKNYVPQEIFSKRMKEINAFLNSSEAQYKKIISESGLRDISNPTFKKTIIDSSIKNIKSTDEVDLIVKDLEKKDLKKRQNFSDNLNRIENSENIKKSNNSVKSDDDIIFTRSY